MGFADQPYKPKAAVGGDRGSVRIAPAQELKDVDFRLVPHGMVSGRVLDEDGEPMPSAMVSALSYNFAQGQRRLVPADIGPTNSRGEFNLGKLPPGHYVLCADVQRIGLPGSVAPAPADGAPETGYVSTFMPNATDAAQAQKVDIAPGAEVTGLSIHVQKSRVVRVKGKLTDETGQPIKSAQIMMMAGGRIGSMSMTMVNDPEGKFEIANLQPGSYSIMTMQMQGSSPKISMQPLTVPDKNIDDLKLGARTDATIQGKVAIDGDAQLPLKAFTVTLTAAGGLAVMPATGKADETGAFTLAKVVPAVYDLTFPSVPAGAYLKSVDFNGRDVLGRELDCSGLTTGALRVVLGVDGGKVEGHVAREDKPAADATVVLVPADPNRRFPQAVRRGSSDETGRLTLKDIPPGDYLAFAWEKVEDGAWYDPEFMKAAQSQAVKVQIRAKATEQVELKLILATEPRP